MSDTLSANNGDTLDVITNMIKSSSANQLFSALSSEARRDILSCVLQHENGIDISGVVQEIEERISFSVVARHLGQLEQAGLLTVKKSGRQKIYAGNKEFEI